MGKETGIQLGWYIDKNNSLRLDFTPLRPSVEEVREGLWEDRRELERLHKERQDRARRTWDPKSYYTPMMASVSTAKAAA